MKPLNVMVTGIGGGGHGEQILKALRLAETKYEVVGTDISVHSKGLSAVDHAYIVPPASDPMYIETLLNICNKHDVKAVFHGSEPELMAMNSARYEIEDHGLFLPINPPSIIDLCMNKVRTCEFLKDNKFHVPIYKQIKSLEDLEDFDVLPAVLKPSIGGGGSAHVFLAQRQDEVFCFGRYLLSFLPEFIIQEYIGTPDSEFTVGVLISMDGELLNSIAVKRNILCSLSNRINVPNITSRTDLGPILALSNGISQGEIGRFPEVTQICEEIAVSLGCRGVLNLQCRFVKDRVYVFEINPRFSGTTSLRAMVGYNEPDLLIRRHLLGELIKAHFSYESGVIVRGLSESLIGHRTFLNGREI